MRKSAKEGRRARALLFQNASFPRKEDLFFWRDFDGASSPPLRRCHRLHWVTTYDLARDYTMRARVVFTRLAASSGTHTHVLSCRKSCGNHSASCTDFSCTPWIFLSLSLSLARSFSCAFAGKSLKEFLSPRRWMTGDYVFPRLTFLFEILAWKIYASSDLIYLAPLCLIENILSIYCVCGCISVCILCGWGLGKTW